MKQLRQFLMLLTTLLVSQSAMAEYYGIQVGGVKVTSENCMNITGEFINGFASYDPNSKTLTLDCSIVRTGSGNRAILNESCDGLIVNITGGKYHAFTSENSSPLRFNANTTLTGDVAKFEGRYEDVITVGNGATLTISNFQEITIDG